MIQTAAQFAFWATFNTGSLFAFLWIVTSR